MLPIKKRQELRPFFSDVFGELFNDEFFWPTGTRKEESVIPALNVKDDEKEIQLELVVPGFKKEDIKISLDKDVLTISSELKEERTAEDEKENFLKREFYYNSFKRCVRIPEDKIDNSRISAEYEDGILKLHLPKKEKKKLLQD